MLPNQLQNLISQFSQLPGIGPRQAARFAFYLLRNQEEMSSLAGTLKSVHSSIELCTSCFLPALNRSLAAGSGPAQNSISTGTPQSSPQLATGQADPVGLCAICANPKRDKNMICVVEKETDALNFEKTAQFTGHYFVLGGFIDPLNKESVAHERLSILTKKISHQAPKAGTDPALGNSMEIILALTPRREGDFTSLYIEQQLKPLKEQGAQIKTTRLGRGLSSGAELEYADEDTLRNALAGRK